MKTAGVGGGRARALTAEEAGTGWPALLSVPATRLYCPSTDDRTDLGQRPACDSSSRPYCPGLRSNKGKQTHAGVDFLCFQAVISFCVTLSVCDCHTHEGFLGVVSAGFLGADQVPGANGPRSLSSHSPTPLAMFPRAPSPISADASRPQRTLFRQEKDKCENSKTATGKGFPRPTHPDLFLKQGRERS